jgi:hypothetical protein
MAIDAAAVLLGVMVSSAVRRPGGDGLAAVATMVAAYALWLGRARLYRSRFITRRADEVRRIVDAGVRTAASVGLLAFVAELDVDRRWLLASTVTTANGCAPTTAGSPGSPRS